MISKADKNDVKALSELASQLYKISKNQLIDDLNRYLEDQDALILVLKIDNKVQGFSHVQSRHDYVEGCKSSPVGYLEGIYIMEQYRRRGYASEMLEKAKLWAKEKGCYEFASDTELGNEIGYVFHKNSGFMETNRLITFKQDL